MVCVELAVVEAGVGDKVEGIRRVWTKLETVTMVEKTVTVGWARGVPIQYMRARGKGMC